MNSAKTLFILLSCLMMISCHKGSPSHAPASPDTKTSLSTEQKALLKPWSQLVEQDKKSSLLGKRIKIGGFMIPDDSTTLGYVHEFLLTPIPGGCIHVPPPPPDYILHVIMNEGKSVDVSWKLTEVTGVLKLAKSKDKNYFAYEFLADTAHEAPK
ncbi:MAG: DUF3299 domain-containing protein [Bdellovibrionota bacterium]